MERFAKLDILNLTAVEREIDIMIETIGNRIPDNEEIEHVTKLINLANSLGTKRNW
jgi:hypothetical protein